MSTKRNYEEEGNRCAKLFDPVEKIPDFDMVESTREALCFREDLLVSRKNKCSSDSDEPVGGYCISVERIGSEGNEFMIQAVSSLTVDDSFAGSKVTASSTERLHCLEEKRTEYVNRRDGLYEKTLYLGLEEEVYHVEVEDRCPCDKSATKIDLPLASHRQIISEGSSVLLVRYLALKNYHGSLSFVGLTIGGRLTTSNYRCSEARKMKFNGHETEVYTVERRIHEACGLVHNSKTLLTKNGRILRHDWLELPYLLKINSLLDPNEIVDRRRPKIRPPLRLRWNSDVQLTSIYLDKKALKDILLTTTNLSSTCRMARQTEYLADHPEIRQLIGDFTLSLLAAKPINVLSYAIQHFAAFAKNAETDGSDESNLCLIPSQLSKRKFKRVCSICGVCFESPMSAPTSSNVDSVRAVESSVTPETSSCSIFAKCPSDAPCNLHLRGTKDGSVTSSCSIFAKCPSYASCAKRSTGGGHSRRLRTNSPAGSSSCSVFSSCPSNASCVGKFPSCSDGIVTNCSKDCEGCRNGDKSKLSVCSLRPECENTCEGCRERDENSRTVCSLRPDCENTCEGCRERDESRRSICSLHPVCEMSCEGCRADLGADTCLVLEDCTECPGCRKVCDEVAICPDCVGCGGVDVNELTNNRTSK